MKHELGGQDGDYVRESPGSSVYAMKSRRQGLPLKIIPDAP